MSLIYCDDWGCPAKASCRHHFWRSPEYAAMDDAAEIAFFDKHRDPDADSCYRYERDEVKDWLT